MTFVIPTAVDLMTDSVNSHPNARGGFAGVGEGQTSQRGFAKAAGNLPLTLTATNLTSSNDGQLRGFNFGFPTAIDTSTNTKLIVWTYQFNAPNRVQTDTVTEV